MDMLPSRPVGGHGLWRYPAGGWLAHQGGGQVVPVRRLGQVVNRPQLHSGDGGSDGAKGGQYDGAAVRAMIEQRPDHGEALAVSQPNLNHSEGWGGYEDGGPGLREIARASDFEALRFEGPRGSSQMRFVIVHQEETQVPLWL